METLVLREERPSFNYLNDFGGFWKPGAPRKFLLQSYTLIQSFSQSRFCSSSVLFQGRDLLSQSFLTRKVAASPASPGSFS